MNQRNIAALSQAAAQAQHAPQLSFVKDERNQCLSFTFTPPARQHQGVLIDGHPFQSMINASK